MTDLSTVEARFAIAYKYATKHNLDPYLVCAVAEQESSWNPWAIRYEPLFYQRYIVPLNIGQSTEGRARAFSWGLMQVMGEVAREHEYMGPFAQLCDPDVGMDVGCKVLAKKLDLAKGEVERALQLWNGGSNLNYHSQVLARIPHYQEAHT